MHKRALQPRASLAAASTLLLLLCSMIIGCVGLRTPGERDSREQVQKVLSKYRPTGVVLELPALRSGGSPETFVRYAIYQHPQVEAAYYEWLASVEKITRERSLPDPRLTFQADLTQIIMALMPGLMMDFPGPGKLRAAAKVATAEGGMKYFQFETAVLQVAYGFKKAWYDLRLVDERIRVNQEMVTLLQELEKLAQSRTEVGKGSLQDLLRTQMEKERLQTELTNLRDSRGWFVTQFKAALGLGAGDPTPPLPRSLQSSPLSTSGDQILATAMARNPRLKAMEADVRRAEAALVVARKTRLPDFALGVMADVKASPVMVRPLGGMTLPIWRDKIAAEIEGARDLQGASQARLSNERLTLTVEVAMKSYMYRESTRLVALLQNILLPKAKQSLEVARSGYSTGGTDFINLIDAQRTLLEFRLAEVEARIKRELALADLSLQIMGVPPSGAPVLDPSRR
ncbi:MAG: TolC family protein [Prosthecobacter sp.]|uniref:TolC family protein n=1 Tax=Prosthecobacter sp. TaxID=1965333 RepID=UPI003BB1A541